jgi:predicted histone-like DNA-binding protein
MAVNVIAFQVGLQKNNNAFSKSYQKYFAKPWYPKTLSLKGLISRVAWDQSVYSNDIIKGVVAKLTTTMVELLRSGQPVKWEGLGTFRPTIENKNGGINAAKVLSGDFNVADQIEGVSIAFIPENAKGEALTSRKFRDLCVFEDVGIIETTAVPGNNGLESATKYFQKVIPGETWRKEANKPAPDPEPEP